uniref:Gastrokine 2 n=1 Tax=Zosterops lateralis melanops TaxID=1220523 RepID=A0A8D2P5S1_ZOSLA
MILCFLPKTFALRDPVSNYVTGTMTIHSEEHIVDVHVRSGVYSSDTIFDYTHGYIATRLFSRNACFIMKIKKELIPELREIGRLDVYSPNNVWALFQAGSSRLGRFKDWILYGKHIENLCTGLPLYQLVATERKSRIRGIVSALGTFLPFEPKLSWYLGAVQTFLPIELHHKCFAVLRQKQKP